MILTTDLRQAADVFLDVLRDHRYSPLTLEAYDKELRRVLRLLDDPPRATDRPLWSAPGLERVLGAIARGGASAVSLARTLSACRQFERFCVERGILADAPAQSIEMRFVARHAPQALPTRAFEVALRLLGESGPAGRREHAVLELTGAAGLGAAELARLRVRDVDLRNGRLTVRASDGLIRIAKAGPRTLEVVKAHLEEGGHGERPAAFVVAGRALRPLSALSIHRLLHTGLQHLANRLGVSPHEVRECFEAWSLECGTAPEEIRRATGELARTRSRRFMPASPSRRPRRPRRTPFPERATGS